MVIVVSSPLTDFTVVFPLWLCTMPWTIASPKPVPLVFVFVEKKGSNTWGISSSAIPTPLSTISIFI